ncbi:MAG TPA: family 16 glycosylhydrolase [Nocardioides sp.]|nr:family 16 glycosylhydrolase [Nocardioides sp.]
MSPLLGRVARGSSMTVLLLVGALLLPGSAEVAEHAGPPAARAGQVVASQKYGWQPSLFDFAWEYGESLTDRPGRGTKRKGKWIDVSTGSGRAARHNGGMMLESSYGVVTKRDVSPDFKDGDRGTTSVTLKGNAQAYGRWEVRFTTWTQTADGDPYDVRFELVPEGTKPDCRATSIKVAQVTATEDRVDFGAYSPSGDKAWTGSKGGVPIGARANEHAFAVEVAKDHITWFIDGQPVGTTKDKAAIPGVPLTIRLSLAGNGTNEMRHTYALFDWMRGFPLDHGKHPVSKTSLSTGTQHFSC